jgi:two-component system response regulator EvgA
VPSVLIVDDEPNFRATARALLETEGFEIVGEAEDGAGAIEAARRLDPEVVLLDIRLPDMDGFEVAAELAADAGPTTVVLISSRDPRDFGGLIERSGARGFLAKGDVSGPALAALLH